MITKIANNTLAIFADSLAMSVNPKMAAISAITRKIIVQNSIICPSPRAREFGYKKMTLAVPDTRRKRPKDGRRVNAITSTAGVLNWTFRLHRATP
jgi:hypothetical protein